MDTEEEINKIWAEEINTVFSLEVAYKLQLFGLTGNIFDHPHYQRGKDWPVFDAKKRAVRIIQRDLIPTTYSVHERPNNYEDEKLVMDLVSNFVRHKVIWNNDPLASVKIWSVIGLQNKEWLGRLLWKDDGKDYIPKNGLCTNHIYHNGEKKNSFLMKINMVTKKKALKESTFNVEL